MLGYGCPVHRVTCSLDCANGIVGQARGAARPIRVGVGLHSGDSFYEGGQYVGSAVNLAARLGQNAAAAEILISDVVRGLVGTTGSLPMTERGEIMLKWISAPPRVYSVGWSERP